MVDVECCLYPTLGDLFILLDSSFRFVLLFLFIFLVLHFYFMFSIYIFWFERGCNTYSVLS